MSWCLMTSSWRDKLNSGDPDWWKISVFHQKEYWELMKRSVDQEREVCSPLSEIIGEEDE
jgi:myo-inositol catabolism protein IolC